MNGAHEVSTYKGATRNGKQSGHLIFLTFLITLFFFQPVNAIEAQIPASLSSYHMKSGTPTENTSTSTLFRLGDISGGSSNIARQCLKFDLSSIPSNANITNVSIALYESGSVRNAAPNPFIAKIYVLKQNWNQWEGNWNQYSSGNNWDTAGAIGANDIYSTSSASLGLTIPVADAYYNMSANGSNNLIRDVQSFVNGTWTNNGWLFRCEDCEGFAGSQEELRFHSDDNTNVPILYLSYDILGAVPTVLDINTTVNTTTYNLTINVSINNSDPANTHYIEVNTTDKHGYNNNQTYTLNLISNVSNFSTWNTTTHIHNLGYGNFTITVYNSTNDTITYAGSDDDFNLNTTTPLIVLLQDQVSTQALANTNFSITNTNITTGDVITETYTTNSTGESEISIRRAGNFSEVLIITAGISGYFDSSNTETITQTLPQTITINIEPIGAASQIIIECLDLLTYQPIPNLMVNTTSGHGSGYTDTWGKIGITGQTGAYVVGTINDTTGTYQNRTINIEFYSSVRQEQRFFVRIDESFNGSITVTFLPSEQYLDSTINHEPYVEIENYDIIKNITFVIAVDMDRMNYYDNHNVTSPGEIDTFYFNFEDIDSWCDIDTRCTGTSSAIKFRITDTTINSYGDHVVVRAYVWTDADTLHTYTRGGWFVVVRGVIRDFINRFSPEQLAFLGAGVVLLGSVFTAVRLNLTFRQAGTISIILVMANIAIGIWPIELGIIPALAGVYALIGRE